MALRNFFIPGSYAIIDNVFYSKLTRQLRFDVAVFKDSSKSELITRIPYSLVAKTNIIQVLGILDHMPDDATAQVGDKYIIDTGDYEQVAEEVREYINTLHNPIDYVQGVDQTAEIEEWRNKINNFNEAKLYNKKIVEYTGAAGKNNKWSNCDPYHGQTVNIAGQNYTFNGDTHSWEIDDSVFDSQVFDEHFSVNAMSAQDANILSVIYNWLKEQPESASAIDA